MPTFFPALKDEHQEWIMKQPVFFVASAPLLGRHINVSPKGHPSRTLRILSPNKVAYLDSTGSGCETVSHLYEAGNGRVTIMLNSFGSAPQIMRLFCTGKVVERGAAQYDELVSLFHAESDGDEEAAKQPGAWQQDAIRKAARSVILLDVFKVQTSCGYGVPLLESSISSARAAKLSRCERDESGCWLDRETLPTWGNKHDEKSLKAYWHKSNVKSLDGLPGLRNARVEAGERLGIKESKIWCQRHIFANLPGIILGFLLALIVLARSGALREEYTNLHTLSWSSWSQR